MVALMLPTNVPNSMIPLPQESSRGGSSSGSEPYFDGPNSAPCELIRKTAAHSSGRRCSASAPIAKNITNTSRIFVPMVTSRLL
jgi:hypothetical protein